MRELGIDRDAVSRRVAAGRLFRVHRGVYAVGQPRGRTRSELEDDFLRLCRRSRLPLPEVNVKIGKWEVDFLWRGARLVVETDSYAYHRGSVAFQDDRARDLDLRQRGLDVIRISERQLNGEPMRVAAVVKGALVRLPAS